MTALMPNPFILFPLAAASTVDSTTAAACGDASAAAVDQFVNEGHVTPLPPEPVAEWVPDEDFMDRLYADIVGANDAMPIFLRKPSPAFMQALFRLGAVR